MKNYFKVLYKKLFKPSPPLKDYIVTCYTRGWMSNEYILYREAVKASDSYKAEMKSFGNNWGFLYARLSNKEKVPYLKGVRWEVTEVDTGEVRKCSIDCSGITD